MFLSMFLFVQLLSISAYALPTNISALDERGFLDKLTGNDIVIGYGFVDQNQALSECNPFRTVRAIPAAEKEILEGVYHTSSLDLRPDGLPSNYWEQMINCFRSGQWYALVTLYLYGISKTASKTILFSEYSYSDGKIGYQMLIPPNIWRSRTIIASVSQDGEQIVSVKRPGVISLFNLHHPPSCMSRKVLESYLKNRGKSVPKPGSQGEPLPGASVGHFRSDTSRSTYELCRSWETAAQQYEDKKLIQARVLGYMLYYSPTDAARAAITRAILSCNDNDEQLSELAELYTNFFIRCFRNFNGRSPTTQSHPSPDPFDVMKNVIFSKLNQAPENHSEARAHALLRDGFRDPFTGKYDYLAEQLDAVDPPELLLEFGCASLQVAHIAPDSTYFRLEGVKTDYAASVTAILQQFGYDFEKFKGAKVHSLYNLITMSLDMHDAFNQLRIYLEEIGTNTYRVKGFKQTQTVPAHDIKFSTDDPEFYPVPDRELIALHAMCAKVAHMSGAGAYVEDLDRDVEDLGVLASNGGSADVLSHALAVGFNGLIWKTEAS